MPISGPEMTYRKLRAPQHSGQVLIEPGNPGVATLAERLATNRSRWDQCTTSIAGAPLNQLARQAREQLLDAACDYTGSYRNLRLNRQAIDADTQLIVSGHQPRLFHPGVWFKNFTLHTLAEQRQAIGIHLIIDNDLATNASIRVPTGTVSQPQQTNIEFDRASTPVPFESREIIDADFFREFPQRVKAATHELLPDPCVDPLWSHATEAMKRTNNLGLCLSQARHQLEADYGLDTLEVPLSTICDQSSFLQFAAHLLLSPSELRREYNEAIEEYRSTNRLRSNSHPAPLLEEFVENKDEEGPECVHGIWQEAPFWIWSRNDATRDRLFVRTVIEAAEGADNEIELCRGVPSAGGERIRVPIATAEDDPFAVGKLWLERLLHTGQRIRPRALITTLFARVFLSDLFLHGIGGAKYDQVTDQLLPTLLGISPPDYLTVTATLHLPIPGSMVDADDLRRINGMLRELWYHPETMVEFSTNVGHATKTANNLAELKKKKKKLLRAFPPRGERKAWNDDLERINTALRELAQPLRSILQQQRSELIQRMRSDSILTSREYAFCLFSAANIGPNLLDMVRIVS